MREIPWNCRANSFALKPLDGMGHPVDEPDHDNIYENY